jgi:hypothetical protein
MSLSEARHHRWFRALHHTKPPAPASGPTPTGSQSSQHREPAPELSTSSAGGDVDMIPDDDEAADEGMAVDATPDGPAAELDRLALQRDRDGNGSGNGSGRATTPDARHAALPNSPASTAGFMVSHMPGAYPHTQRTSGRTPPAPAHGRGDSGGAPGKARIQRRAHVLAEMADHGRELPQPSQEMIANAASQGDRERERAPAAAARRNNKRKSDDAEEAAEEEEEAARRYAGTPGKARARAPARQTRGQQQQPAAIEEEDEPADEPPRRTRAARAAKKA